MKKSKGRKQKKYPGRINIAFLCLAVVLAGMNLPSSATGSSLDDTREQMEEAEREKERREQELAAAEQALAQTQSNLANLEDVKNTYQGQMQILNESLQ